ncbi:GNAT family N-acetyltransferase [Peribacillus sp. SCS-155]|uniref:GNAT family N-acetyltransferase n=1 Tax=Peribacillus sedimenti TaxID=3115297 RepID=UPI00390598F3
MSITLREITKDNWEDCIMLQVADSQKEFVAPNIYSLAESKFETSFVPLSVYSGEEMVGFLMYGQDPEDGNYWLVRLMIDKNNQGRGYGKKAVALLIEALRQQTDQIIVGYKPDNLSAQKLYAAAGFRETGEIMHGEKIAILRL